MSRATTVTEDELVLQARITRLARTDPDWEVRLSALDFVRDPDALDEIAATDRSMLVRTTAANRRVDLAEAAGELAVIALAREARASATRVAATRRIAVAEARAQLATSPFDEQVRRAAVEALSDEQLLCHVACNDTHWSVRLAAVERIRSTTTLTRVATRERNPAVRLAARVRLADVDTRPVPRQSLDELR